MFSKFPFDSKSPPSISSTAIGGILKITVNSELILTGLWMVSDDFRDTLLVLFSDAALLEFLMAEAVDVLATESESKVRLSFRLRHKVKLKNKITSLSMVKNMHRRLRKLQHILLC